MNYLNTKKKWGLNMVTLWKQFGQGKINLVYYLRFYAVCLSLCHLKRCSCFWKAYHSVDLHWAGCSQVNSPGFCHRNGWKVKPWLSFLTLMTESQSEGYIKLGQLAGSWGRERPRGKGAKNAQRDRGAAGSTLFVFLWATRTQGRSCIYNTTFVAN